jgi:nitrogen regulatory protein PII
MKLLLITAVESFKDDVMDILSKCGVKAFSYQEVKGHKNDSDDSDTWFVSSHNEFDSLLFTVFIDKDCVDNIYNQVIEFNDKQKSLSHIHVATLQIEKSI